MARYFAALPMYDPPELHEANDALWGAISSRLVTGGLSAVPDRLTRTDDMGELWRQDGLLLLGQTCGYPLMKEFPGRFQLVATPLYQAEGCEGPFHRSAIVVRHDSPANHLGDLRGGHCAVNDWASNTGMNLLRARIAPLATDGSFFGRVTVSGSHRQSLEWVAAGTADVAAIDCVTLALLRNIAPDLVAAVKILDWTARSPALPLITAAETDSATLELLRRALRDVVTDPGLAATSKDLLIKDFKLVPLQVYRAVLDFEEDAIKSGYPTLS
ncbi:hypothetical protein VTK73DRAFT_9103 [Phialemonium thermophilum]|uniref:Phosphate ABC transporter substrate-binding protein n=1 Tax=Phialemonium thermophilum TaxID=223376 RepID=A0ABR3XLL5_9PEZI